jgi:hypothetical protein
MELADAYQCHFVDILHKDCSTPPQQNNNICYVKQHPPQHYCMSWVQDPGLSDTGLYEYLTRNRIRRSMFIVDGIKGWR